MKIHVNFGVDRIRVSGFGLILLLPSRALRPSAKRFLTCSKPVRDVFPRLILVGKLLDEGRGFPCHHCRLRFFFLGHESLPPCAIGRTERAKVAQNLLAALDADPGFFFGDQFARAVNPHVNALLADLPGVALRLGAARSMIVSTSDRLAAAKTVTGCACVASAGT
jgi:hypothetical protein